MRYPYIAGADGVRSTLYSVLYVPDIMPRASVQQEKGQTENSAGPPMGSNPRTWSIGCIADGPNQRALIRADLMFVGGIGVQPSEWVG